MVDHILKISRPGVFEIRCLSWNTAIIVFMKKLRMDTLFHKKTQHTSISESHFIRHFPRLFWVPRGEELVSYVLCKKLTINQFAFTFEPVCFNF